MSNSLPLSLYTGSLTSVSLGIYQMTKYSQSGNTIVYNDNNEDYVNTGVDKMKPVRAPHPLSWPHKSFTQQGRIILI